VYVFDFSAFAKIASATILLYYFVLRDFVDLSRFKSQAKDPLFETSSWTSSDDRSPGSASKVQSVFEDFQNFTSARSSPGSSSGGQSQFKRRSRKRSAQGQQNRSRSQTSKKSPVSKNRNTKKKTQTDHHLQKAVHHLARDKQDLEAKVAKIEKKFLLAEDKLKQERTTSKRYKNEIAKLKNRRTTDNRSPEEILGLKPGQFGKKELREAWIRESKRWHTSNMVNKPAELVKLADEELKRVNAANDKLKKLI
jgi:hypothetical protein